MLEWVRKYGLAAWLVVVVGVYIVLYVTTDFSLAIPFAGGASMPVGAHYHAEAGQSKAILITVGLMVLQFLAIFLIRFG